MESCKGRVTKESLKVVFGDNKHYFYLEERCSKNNCSKCSTRTSKGNQYAKSFDHGYVDQPIPEKSHMYDGAWYKTSVKKYGQPSEETIAKAIEAQKKARGELIVETVTATVPKPKTKRTIKTTPTTATTTTTTVSIVPVDSIVETTDEPLEVKQVIVLKPFMTHYWRDEERDKVYKNNNGKKGIYVGRWNSEKIVECPDSDEE